ncbi:V-type proton ATPase subunit a [Entamoeba marina]
MGELLRSQVMSYGQLILPTSIAESTVETLGELGNVQFVDLNSSELSFNRRYCNELTRCDELDRKLRYFEETIIKEEERKDMNGLKFRRHPEFEVFEKESTENLELKLESLERDLKQGINNCKASENDLEKIEEGLLVTTNIDLLFENMEDIFVGGLKFIIGVVEKKKYDTIQRLIWRVSRGLVLIKSMDLADNSELRNFLVVYQGEDLEVKINKICSSSGARIYSNIPLDIQERHDFVNEATSNKQQLSTIFEQSTREKRDLLRTIALQLEDWKEIVKRERMIYFTLNMFKVDRGHNHLRGECWYPSSLLDSINQELTQIGDGAIIPPTYMKTNGFTQGFQDLTDSYGTPRYGEISTGWLNIVTFPWLFGLMFSDAGHGLFIFSIGFLFVIFQRKLKKIELNEMVLMLFDARWLLMFMGIMAMYCGSIYNEFFGLSIDLFGTSWNKNDGESYYREDPDYVYYYGIDPIWKSSNNELYFVNSLKMKLSIIIGVFHMTFGIFLSLFNHIHFRKYINIWFHWIPEMIFMICSFGYLTFLIIFKWAVPVIDDCPMLTNVFLEMFQNFAMVTDENYIFYGQKVVEPILLLLIIFSIALMFIPKPIIDYIHMKKSTHKTKEHMPLLEEQGDEENAFVSGNEYFEGLTSERSPAPEVEPESEESASEEQIGLMEIVIFNSIHGIEFILGCISNTASYLRLWALSLAHAELGTVFLEKVFYMLLEMNIFITIFVGFAVWAAVTVAVLIGMEALSAFLHTLRLHWIEFQNKFYNGDGVPFVPFKIPKRHKIDEIWN